MRKTSSRYVGVEHNSLVVILAGAVYFWNSRGEQGDVFDFVGRYHLGYDRAWNKRDTSCSWKWSNSWLPSRKQARRRE